MNMNLKDGIIPVLIAFALGCPSSNALNCPNNGTPHTSSLTSLTLSPITVNFTAPETCGTAPYDYTAYGTCDIALPYSLNSVDLHITNVKASWTETDTGDISNRSISWNGAKLITTVGGVNFIISSIQFSESPSYSASIKVIATVPGERVIQDIVYIQPKNLGYVTITYKSDGSETIDFSALKGPEIQLKAGASKTEFANASIGSFTQHGEAQDVSLSLLPNVEFDAKGFKAVVDSLNLTFDYDIAFGSIRYKSGSGTMTLKEIEGCGANDTIQLSLTFDPLGANVSMRTESELHAFGFDIGPSGEGQTAAYSCLMNYNFEITEVKVENAKLSRTTGNSSFLLNDVDFLLKNGKLDSISCDAGNVEYATYKFDISGVSYSSDTKALTINNATLGVKDANFSVSDFVMSENGTISSLGLSVDFTKDPLETKVAATLDTTSNPRFVADTIVKIKNTDLSGTVLIGSQTEGATRFAYGYVELDVSSHVPIGPTGLQFTQFGAKAGWNYNVGTQQPDNSCDIVLGGTVGVGDKANAFELVNEITYTLGTSSAIELIGQVNVPKNDPMLSGELTANYMFGSGEVGGTLSSSLRVPHDTGAYIDLTSGTINYHFDSNGYDAETQDGAGPSGSLFSLVQMDGSFDVAGNYNTGLQSASIDGHLDYYLSGNSFYPENFTEAGGWQATAFGDFGYNVQWDVDITSNYYLTFHDDGFDGGLDASFNTTATMFIDWPNLPFFGANSDVPIPYVVGVKARVEIFKNSNNQIWLEGSSNTCNGDGGATFTYDGETKDGPIYCYLGQF